MSTRPEPGDERNEAYEPSRLPARQAAAGRQPSQAGYDIDGADPPRGKSTREFPHEPLGTTLGEAEGR
jgi:hypothetical protein